MHRLLGSHRRQLRLLHLGPRRRRHLQRHLLGAASALPAPHVQPETDQRRQGAPTAAGYGESLAARPRAESGVGAFSKDPRQGGVMWGREHWDGGKCGWDFGDCCFIFVLFWSHSLRGWVVSNAMGMARVVLPAGLRRGCPV